MPFETRQTIISQLKADLKSSKVMTLQYMTALDALLNAVAEDAQQSLSTHEMPVYVGQADPSYAVCISPSTKGSVYQVTRYCATGALGDSQYKSLRELVSSEGIAMKTRLHPMDAETRMQALMEAEMVYQASKLACI